jgi:hypothetical protein
LTRAPEAVADGPTLVVGRDLGEADDLYLIRSLQGTPHRRLLTRRSQVLFASPSSDGLSDNQTAFDSLMSSFEYVGS